MSSSRAQSTKKDIIVAAATALVVLIIIAVVVAFVVAVVIFEGRKEPPTSKIFKSCEGYSGPIGEILISACPKPDEVGYCEFDRGHGSSYFYWSFIPRIDIAAVGLALLGPDEFRRQSFECTPGGRSDCPAKADRRHEIWNRLQIDFSSSYNSTQLKLNILDHSSHTGDVIYCVEFPAKIV